MSHGTTTQEGEGKQKNKKSLFAQQFESHAPEYFGVQLSSHTCGIPGSFPPLGKPPAVVRRDIVDPILLGAAVSEHSEQNPSSSDVKSVAPSTIQSDHSTAPGSNSDQAQARSTGPENTCQTGLTGLVAAAEGVAGDQVGFGVTPGHGSVTQIPPPTLVSGEGLVSGVGVSGREGAGPGAGPEQEVQRIHEENVERLRGLSEEEILQEKERIEHALGV